ncbi:uncharacterized protein LOC108471481 [Gossypium arboreum]|uniref:uncharacterized protein LOC108471481 n=1 Tax=Gossypium arboreum TaxID=29729 RepID=UPI0008192258|nr:uncharacterized protein LOC108471481 [Gossypium arboreum]
MSSNQARDEFEEAGSYAQASVQRATSSSSRMPMSSGWEEAKAAFLEIIDGWFVPVDKPRKYGAKEFRATIDDDLEQAEFWLKNTLRVLDELSCTPEECLKCAVSLLKDTAYNWWKTISSKRKEFLELKQGEWTVSEYKREFVRLSQYAQEWVQNEAKMCKRFKEGLNEYAKPLIGILEIREFVVLADRAKKAEKLSNEKKQAERKAQVPARDSWERRIHLLQRNREVIKNAPIYQWDIRLK